MKTVLYIHGYNGSPNGSSYQLLYKYINDECVFISFDYDDKDGIKAHQQLTNYLNVRHFDYIIASSLGAYLLLSTITFDIPCIVINPCYIPEDELPKIVDDKNIIDSWSTKNFSLPMGVNKHTIGIFSTNDELLGDKYVKSFEHDYRTTAIRINGGHHVNDDIARTVAAIINAAQPYFY